ncbi:MAG TPA: PAS domain S-box protein, partial [Spirochaetota bacterium]|nr:PAS domain S-box protein [Spirochaetota bacterium]
MLELSETEVYIFEPGSYKIRWVNQFAKKNTGYSRLKLLSSTVMILNPRFSLERLDAGLSSLVKGEENFKLFTTTFVRSNGSKYPVEVNIFFDKSMNIFVATAHDITAKKEMFKAFEENVAVLSTMLQHMPDLIWRQDENGSIIFCNSSMEKFLAKKNKEIVSKKISEIFDSDNASKIDTVTSQAWSSGAIAIDTIDINFNNSGKIFFEITAVPIKDRKSNVESILVIAHNITEKIMAHEALRDSEDLYRKFIDASDDLIFLKDQNLNYVIVNLANARFFDKKISDIIGKSDFDLMDYNLALQCRDSDIKAMESGALIISDEEHHGKVYESRKFPVYARNGRKFIGGYIRDITESVNLARNLEISANQWRQTFDSIDDMIWLLDRDFTIVRANKSSEKFLNLKPQELIGKKCWEVIHNSYMPPETCPYNSIKNKKSFENCFIEMNDKFFSVSLFPVVDNSGSIDSIVHIVRDITKEKQAEKRLLESEELFRSLFENHSAIKLILDPDGGKIIEANEAAVDFYGWSKEELKSMSIMQINTLTPEEIQAEINKVKEKKKVYFNFRHRRADGSIRDVEVYSSAITIRGKVYLHSIVHDVTDKKQAEKDLLILVEAIRQAASGIVITDIDGNIIYGNPAFLNMTLYEFNEIIGKNPRDIVKSGVHDNAFYKAFWDTILSGRVWHGD